jgi:hypothetical protein
MTKYLVDENGCLTGKIHLVMRLESQSQANAKFNDDANQAASTTKQPPVLFDKSNLNPTQLKSVGLVLEVSIIEIDAFEMRSVHTFSKNSPFVSVACGKFNETTKVRLLFLLLVTLFTSVSFRRYYQRGIPPIGQT